MLGFDLNDSVYASVAKGMEMFNVDEVVEIGVVHDSVQVVTWWSLRSGRYSLTGIGKRKILSSPLYPAKVKVLDDLMRVPIGSTRQAMQRFCSSRVS